MGYAAHFLIVPREVKGPHDEEREHGEHAIHGSSSGVRCCTASVTLDKVWMPANSAHIAGGQTAARLCVSSPALWTQLIVPRAAAPTLVKELRGACVGPLGALQYPESCAPESRSIASLTARVFDARFECFARKRVGGDGPVTLDGPWTRASRSMTLRRPNVDPTDPIDLLPRARAERR